MKKIANFIVEKRIIIMIVMVIFGIVSATLIPKVVVNSDMSKYLPDNSFMKMGIDVMEKEFPDTSTDSTIRVMFEDLSDEDKSEMLEKLEAVEYVDSVDYEADSWDYNKDGYTKYVLHTTYDYASSEEVSIEDTLIADFSVNNMQYKNDNANANDAPNWVYIVCVVLLFGILFIMCASWFEPVLFMIIIGLAVIINLGTNLIMGDISEVSSSIASILQLILSMDYFIILTNRYRQECNGEEDHVKAMKKAVTKAFASIVSSSVTTIVGLLTLVFMNFKIGQDLGIVLAKGVFISVICIFILSPGLILSFDKLIQKTAKKVPQIPTKALAHFSYRFRHALLVVFVVLFAGVFMVQQDTEYTYSIPREDLVAEVFPTKGTIVAIYENADEDAITALANEEQEKGNIDSVTNYSTTLGKQYTVAELVDELDTMDDMDLDMDESILDMIYYYHFSDAKISSIKINSFLTFITNDVNTNETFADQFDDDMKEQMDTLKKFENADTLQNPMTSQQMAEFFGMEKEDCEKLYLLYTIKNGGIDTGSMTVSKFVNFILDDVAKDPDYSSQFDDNALDQMRQLRQFTDKTEVTKEQTYTQLAKTLGMDSDMVKMLYVYYYANETDVAASAMTLPKLVSFLQNDVLKNDMMASSIDENTKAQINVLAKYTDKNEIQSKKSAKQLADSLGMDEMVVTQLLMLKSGDGVSVAEMSEKEFVDFLVSDVISNKTYAAQFDEATIQNISMLQSIMNMTVSDTRLNEENAASLLGIDQSMVRLLYIYHESGSNADTWTLSLESAVNYVIDNQKQLGSMMDQSALSQLSTAQKLINATVSGKKYSSKGMADLLGMEFSQIDMMYTLNVYKNGDTSKWMISPEKFIHFLTADVLSDEEMAKNLDADTKKNLISAEKMVDGVISDKQYSVEEMAKLIQDFSNDLDQNQIELLYIYYFAMQDAAPEQTMSMMELADVLCNDILKDERFDEIFDNESRQNILDMQTEIQDGITKLRGENHSILVMTTNLPIESEETTAFFENWDEQSKDKLSGDCYLIGDSAMSYEMSKTFKSEFNLITILSAIAVFIIVAITFRNVVIPTILVLLIQCGVYAAVSLIGVWGFDIYYMSILVVQSILMGATIDYAIVFTNYYREKRQVLDKQESLVETYSASIHTIQTSGLVMILVTGALGLLLDDSTGQICQTLSIGAFFAIMLILFILPAILITFDRFIVRKRR